MFTDNISLAKIISCCTSRGKTAVRLVIETHRVNKETLGEFIDTDEAYRRISVFVTTPDFLLRPEENQKDVAVFLIAMKSSGGDSPTEGLVAEEVIIDELQKMVSIIRRAEV